MLDGWEIDLYAIISSFPKGSNTLMTSDHDRHFLNPPIGWEISGGPTSFYSRLPWIRASMSKNGWKSHMKSTWHPYMSKNEWYLVVTMIFWLENPNRLSDWKNEMKTTMSRITLLVICSMPSSCFPLKKNPSMNVFTPCHVIKAFWKWDGFLSVKTLWVADHDHT